MHAGMSHQQPFRSRSQPRSTRPLELVHTDIMGPFNIPNVMNKSHQYIVSFIDDYGHFGCIYFMEKRSEVLSKFKLWMNYALANFSTENYRVKHLVVDNGAEYFGGEFNGYC